MKIRTQLILGAALFGVVLVVIAASMVTTTAELGRLEQQVQAADRIGLGANDLSYLANEYLLYGDPQQRDRWNARYAALGDDIADLSAGTPARQALVAAITEDRLRLKVVFDGVADERGSGPADPATLPVAWSRVGVQTQGLAYDASRLSALLHAEAHGVQTVNSLLAAALLGAFAIVLLTNYLVVGRRTIQSLSTVLAGAQVIGSGNLDHAIPVTGDDEVGELSTAFNRMTADLRTVTASRAELEREVAERTKAEAMLRQSLADLEEKEAELDSVALFPAQNPWPVLRVDEGGRLLYTNPAGSTTFGASNLQIGDPLPESLARILPGSTPGQIERPFGANTYSIAVVPFEDQHYVNLYFTDITERKRAEEDLRQSREWFRVMGEALPYGVWRCNARGGAEYVSQSFLDLLEMTEDEMREFGWTHRLPPDEVAPMLERWMHCVETGEDWDDEHHVLGPDGNYHAVLTRGRPVRDQDGEIVAWVGINLDIDDRTRAEEALRDYAEDLRRSNEDLERFAYVSSHDLQEPLRSIVSFSQLLERRYRGQLGEDADEYIDFIVEGGNRMQQLIQDLLAYSRVNTTKQALTPTATDDVLAAVERNLALRLTEAGAVLTHDPLPMVLADPMQLEQVFTNLVSNAIKFRRPDAPLRVHVGARRLDGFWEFSVKDNGIGIEPQYFDRIFVIFQRLHTKETYPGTGIGLAIVKRIVDRHGGRIWIESTPGEGATFLFTLPDESFKSGGGGERPPGDPGPGE